MKKTIKKLKVHRETLSQLDPRLLTQTGAVFAQDPELDDSEFFASCGTVMVCVTVQLCETYWCDNTEGLCHSIFC